eukprot:Rmarinus@m.15866
MIPTLKREKKTTWRLWRCMLRSSLVSCGSCATSVCPWKTRPAVASPPRSTWSVPSSKNRAGERRRCTAIRFEDISSCSSATEIAPLLCVLLATKKICATWMICHVKNSDPNFWRV